MSYYYPERTYHQLNSEDYPDSSFTLTGVDGVVRAFWKPGQQMWDEDFENNREWLSFWQVPYAYWRNEPRWPYYSPLLHIFLSEPDHTDREPWVSESPRAIVYDYQMPLPPDKAYKMFAGSRCYVIAEGVYVGTTANGNGIRGLARVQEYLDEIEIAVFISEARRGRIVAAYRAVKPFRLHAQSYSSRVRGMPFLSPQLEVLRNGVKLGTIYKAQYSSGLSLSDNFDFEEGDMLQIRAPSSALFRTRKNITLSIVGELL